MAATGVRLTSELMAKPWLGVRLFLNDRYLSNVPEHYKRFYWEWKFKEPQPVHYIPKPGNFEKIPNGDILPVQNIPLPIKKPKELQQGIWGGEAVIKGFQKRHPLRRRVPHYWVPNVKSSTVYSEILNQYMTVTVTDRTLRLIDQHYGFDYYIMETAPADLMSTLALKVKREMLLALVRETIYPDNPAKKAEILKKYEKFIIPAEEAEWFGLTLREAGNKQRQLEEEMNEPQPLKHKFRQEFVEYLKDRQQEEEAEAAEEKQGLLSSSWLNKVNPFTKKQDD